MLYTKQQVADNIRNRDGRRVFYLAKDALLTSEARDWLNAQKIEILPAEQAKNPAYRLPSGGIITEKPEYMTHLNGDVLVPKNHPRIRFRGKVDSLEAEILLCQKTMPQLQGELQELLDAARKLIACDVLGEPVGTLNFCGMTEQEQRQRSHFPQNYYGIPHFMPDCTDSTAVLKLNRLRGLVRSAEIAAMDAFCDRDGVPTRPDILQALNRMSSMFYVLMLREKAK